MFTRRGGLCFGERPSHYAQGGDCASKDCASSKPKDEFEKLPRFSNVFSEAHFTDDYDDLGKYCASDQKER